MVFVSAKQRKAFFATGNFARSPRTPTQITPSKSGSNNITAFSYFDGKKLGNFKDLKDVFKRFPKEKEAFRRVMKFRRSTGIRVNTIEDIKKEKRKQNPNGRWDR